MRIAIALAIAGLMLVASATVGLAASGVTLETGTIPAHGSVWFGEGLARFAMEDELPLHGSVWYGAGLATFGVEIPSVNSYDTAMIARASVPARANMQRLAAVGNVNSYDVAMILRGCCNKQLNRESVELALAVVH